MGSCIDFSCSLTMKAFASLLLLSAATAEPTLGFFGDLLGLRSHHHHHHHPVPRHHHHHPVPHHPDSTHPIGFHPFRPSNSNCSYYCSNNGGCVVDYVGPSRPGKTSGSCFPHSYGGGCGGTPPECSNCNTVLTCHEPGVRIDKVSSPPRIAPPLRRIEDCQYNCEGWPYSQCEMSSSDRFGSAKATCINPYFTRGSTAKFSNYPECATVPRGCQRCDDYCARQQGKRDRFSY